MNDKKITITKEYETLLMNAPSNFGGFTHEEFTITANEDGTIAVPADLIDVAKIHGCTAIPVEEAPEATTAPSPEPTQEPTVAPKSEPETVTDVVNTEEPTAQQATE